MENQIKNLEQRLEDQSQKLHFELMEQRKATDEQLRQIMSLLKEKSVASSSSDSGDEQLISNRQIINTPRQLGFTPKLEFPKFEGENSRIWVQKCEKYFQLCKIPEEQKVDFAGINLTGKAEEWFNAYMAVRVTVSWSSFVLDFCARFRDVVGNNVVENFNKLVQTGSIESYLDSFEHLKSLMLQRNPLLNDTFFLDSFVGGLKPGIKPMVKAFKPVTIAEAIEFARLQEEKI